MSLRDSELFALADAADVAAHPAHRQPPATGSSEAAAFAARVLRLRRGSHLLLLGCPASVHADRYQAPSALIVVADLSSAALIAALKAAPSVQPLQAALSALPFRAQSFDAVAEFEAGRALTIESDAEALVTLRALRRLLRRGGRYLCGASEQRRAPPAGPRLTPDRRRVDEAHREAGGIEHRSLRLMRPDGTWERLHERRRWRRFEDAERLLEQAGFEILNVFRDYRQDAADPHPRAAGILLLEAI